MPFNPTPQGALAPSETLLTQHDARRILGVSRTTVYFLRKNGSLPEIKIGSAIRFRLSDLQKVVDRGAKTGSAQ